MQPLLKRWLHVLYLLLVLAACGGKSAQEHMTAAREAIQRGDAKTAVIELKNTLQKDSQSAEGRWLLGKLYLDSGDVLSAEKELQKAYDLGWAPTDVTPALAASQLAQGKYKEVRALHRKEGLSRDARVQLLALQAQAASAMGDLDKATEHLNSALEVDPKSPQALLAKARMLAGQNDLVEAHNILEELLAQNPDNAQAWSLAGDIHTTRQQIEEAMAAYDRSLAIHPEDFGTLFKRGILALNQQNTEVAQKDAKALLKLSASHPMANYLQGLIAFQAKRFDKAITALLKVEPMAERFPLALFFLGSAHLIQGKTDQAGVHAARFHALVPRSERGRKLLATIRLHQRQYKKVPELLQPVLDANPDDVEALNLMASALLASGEIDEGITMLSRVAELQPDSPVAQVRLGAGLLITDKGDDAAENLETALALDHEFQQADILLILNHVRKQDYEAAIKAAKSYRMNNLSSTMPLNLLGKVYQAAGQSEEAKKTYQKALDIEAGDPGANHALAQMALQANDIAKARGYYAMVLAHHDNYLPAMMLLAQIDAREQNWSAMESRLNDAMAAHPQALQPRLTLARYYLSQRRADKVGLVFVSLDDERKRMPKVLYLMALAQLAERESGQAQFTLNQLNKAVPDRAEIHYLMAMSAAGLGEEKQAKDSLQQALTLDANYLSARVALARLAVEEANQTDFDSHLNYLTEQAPQHSDVLLLRAHKARASDDLESALRFAEQAHNKAPSLNTLSMLGSLRAASDDTDSVVALYRSWVEQNPDDIVARMRFADILQRSGSIDESVSNYHEVLAKQPDNLVALNNVAWHIKDTDPKQALKYAKRASEILPDSADVLDTLAFIEYNTQNFQQALRTIERALAIAPQHPTMRYHHAMILAALGQTSLAIKQLEALLEEADGFMGKAEAERLLGSLR